jgi:phospholipase A1
MRTLQLMGISLFMTSQLMADTLTSYQRCILEHLESKPSFLTIKELKARCLATQPQLESESAQPPDVELDHSIFDHSLTAQRWDAEEMARFSPYVLSPHKQNYVLLGAYNDRPNYQVYNISESQYDRWEMKFQLSFKIPVVVGLLGTDIDLYAAYTNLSFWQAYNREISSPFRETVHEPELFMVIPHFSAEDWAWQGWRNKLIQFGVVHQSNGQGGYRSRSWNRVYAQLLFEKDDLILGIKPWYRISEDNDDNPDIDDFLGRYELFGRYKYKEQTYGFMLRNLFDGKHRDTLRVDWSFPLYGRWRGYVQYFYGYGESLIDYNAETRRFGVGLQLTDWL